MSSPIKASHIGFSTPPQRNSPFQRRAESPASPSPLRHATPGTGSPTKNGPSRFARAETPITSTETSWTPRGQTPATPTRDIMQSPLRPVALRAPAPAPSRGDHGHALSKLQPTQVRTLRDGFQILDRDCDGVVNREDVADMLNQLGLPSSPSHVAQFFPPSQPQTIALAAFLNSLAEILADLSPSAELLSAFSAFDDDDSGQVDIAELRDALINTAPEPGEHALALSAAEVDKVMDGFTGRRAFNRNMSAQLGAKRGEVFKYQDFVNSVMGANGGAEGPSREASEA
ncbi:uncharacterized protein F5Z01DRAFT_460128 [Emericellopsis atlantica]|uniref:EF-hand domain-containing protein n=1 Tax=Emericellopsis atlantica TaxID=2614577 RepID=A0A9P7ZT75_9HYPO|nr:uncharacterized protein F5Z01DRAFT_460128 [Emericellopsis atlantica]KAG9257240.1 hypothetical protein F5Z01DRAFT_460128 [Emericellopsis atlantica]